MSEVNKFQFTYHGHGSTKALGYRPAELGGRGTRTIRATQTEQGVAGKKWIGAYERTAVNQGAGSHRTGHVAVEHIAPRMHKPKSLKTNPQSKLSSQVEHIVGPKPR